MPAFFANIKNLLFSFCNSVRDFFKKKNKENSKFLKSIFYVSDSIKKIASKNWRRSFCRWAFSVCSKAGFVRLKRFFAKQYYSLGEVRTNVLVKYISKELFLYFFMMFMVFFVIFFCNQILLLAETILKKRVPVGSVLKLIWYCLPAIIAQSAPFATLVGFLMCLGRMATDNEVLILRATGQRYSLILKPVLIMGMLISVFSFVMNDYFLPLGTINYNKLYKQIILSNPAIELESHSVKRMKDSTLIIGDVEKNNVSDMILFQLSDDGEQMIILSGNTDVQKSVGKGVLMQLNMDDANVLTLSKDKKNEYDYLSADKLTLNVFEDSIITHAGGTSPREMTSWDLGKKIRVMKAEDNVTKRQLNSYRVEYNKKFSIPFGSIFFAILAFPLALVFGRRNGLVLGMIFGVIISVLYWAANILGQIFGIRSGYNGFWMMWGPNFFIGIVGIILYLRLRRK